MTRRELLAVTLALVASGCAHVTSLSSLRALPAGTTVTINGFVTAVPGQLGERTFVLQSGGSGVHVSADDVVSLPPGAHVEVTGTLTQVAQQAEVKTTASAVRVQSGVEVLAPREVATGRLGELDEGVLVRVHGTVMKPVQDDGVYGVKVFLDDGSGPTQVFVNKVRGMPVVDTTTFKPGDVLTVVGIGSQYEAVYEVCPRSKEDVELLR
jgi:DNA/RNA endonuclease YhcR with UshA esterase domain